MDCSAAERILRAPPLEGGDVKKHAMGTIDWLRVASELWDATGRHER
jgi:hypothetical protein